MVQRRTFIKLGTGAAGGVVMVQLCATFGGATKVLAQIPVPGGTLDLTNVSKFGTPLLIPPVMPQTAPGQGKVGPGIDYYEISFRQFSQQILPAGLPATTVWGYGTQKNTRGRLDNRITNAPSLTIETSYERPVRIKWINELMDDNGNYLPHLLSVDPTLHWANPPGGTTGRDMRPTFSSTPGRYTGPVPIVTHVHGAVGVSDESDGYAEAWYLPAAKNIPADYATVGTWYNFFKDKAKTKFGATWDLGSATFQYPNANLASTLWYHDHTLGMTRLNVYAGPAGFYLVSGGPRGDDKVLDSRTGKKAVLPGPRPQYNDKFPPKNPYYEIPIAIQDRSFNTNGSLFYPDTRAFFDNASPYIPNDPSAPNGGFSPIWNPEFFANCIMVNGNTWPFLTVEQRRYRFRILNGCNSRFLILDFSSIPGVEVWVIGTEGGFLAAPVNMTMANSNQILMSVAERYDVIVDFTKVAVGNYVLNNVGPNGPFSGLPIPSADVADPNTTGQVMQFRVVPVASKAADPTTPPQSLVLPPITSLTGGSPRPLALLELLPGGNSTELVLGTVAGDPNIGLGTWTERKWEAAVTENPTVGATEVWEFYNTTGDAHPMHIHEVAFQVVNRQDITIDQTTQKVQVTAGSLPTLPAPWETGFKDTVIAYPGQVTRVRAQFSTPGQFVWHCHIVEHEDNEMMRPYRIGPVQPNQPTG